MIRYRVIAHDRDLNTLTAYFDAPANATTDEMWKLARDAMWVRHGHYGIIGWCKA